MLRNIHANEAEQAKLQRENEQLDQKIQTNLEWVHQVRMQTINPINKQEYITKAVRIRLGLDRESEEMESRQGKGIPQGEGRSREQEGGQVDEGGQGEEGGQGREDGQGEQDGQGREVDMVD